MIFSNNESIEDAVIRVLPQGVNTVEKIYASLKNENYDVSLRGVYKAIKKLRNQGIVLKNGKILSVSQEWIEKINRSLKSQYALPSLSDGESATYNYNSLANLDLYWKHLIISLEEKYSRYPVFMYTPYNIWVNVPGRSESQIEFYKKFDQQKNYGFLVIGNTSPIDQSFKKKYQSGFFQIDTWSKTTFRDSEYFTIISDYIVTTKLGKKNTTIIANYYNKSVNRFDAIHDLENILKTSDKVKIKLERNKRKALLLRKKLFKNFYLPQNYYSNTL